MTDEEALELVEVYRKQRKAFTGFMNNVTDFFSDNESLLDESSRYVVHSVKYRFKDPDHLKEKLKRKSSPSNPINAANLFDRITDFCGVRVLHLRRNDFSYIHSAITSHVSQQHWTFAEPPKAYTWDPEYKEYFDSLGIRNEIKESSYTSVHYLVRPNEDSKVICEIQVRSLFEEIWGEVDHDLNYPTQSTIVACREQLKVLANLVGAGSRLVDSIYSSIEESRSAASSASNNSTIIPAVGASPIVDDAAPMVES